MKYTDTGAFWKTLMLAVFLLVSKGVMAQEIADIPSDPAFKSGVLPNGMRWYVAVNPNVKGIADFALVQNTGLNNVPGVAPDSIIVRSQRVLAARFTADGASVQKFFSRKGCVPGPEGFAQVRDDATVYRFRKINLLQSASVLDSTLFVIMNMAGASEEVGLQEWYAPADQAIVVSGDVDPDVVAQKLQMLSYMLPASASPGSLPPQRRRGSRGHRETGYPCSV